MENRTSTTRLRIVMAIAIVALFLGALGVWKAFAGSSTSSSIRVMKVEVVDDQGIPRLMLGTENGAGAISVFGRSRELLYTIPTPTKESASFEIRDFKITRERESYGGVTFRGRGTLVVKNPYLQEKDLLVILIERETPDKGDPSERDKFVVVSRGTGTIETWDYSSRNDANQTKYQWTFAGYVELSRGVLRAGAP